MICQCCITTLKRIHSQPLQVTVTRRHRWSYSPTMKTKPSPLLLTTSHYQRRRCSQLRSVSVALSASASARPLKLALLPAILHTVLQSHCQTEVSLLKVCQITFCLKICQMQLGLIGGCAKSWDHYTLPVRLHQHVSTCNGVYKEWAAAVFFNYGHSTVIQKKNDAKIEIAVTEACLVGINCTFNDCNCCLFDIVFQQN